MKPFDPSKQPSDSDFVEFSARRDTATNREINQYAEAWGRLTDERRRAINERTRQTQR